MLFDFQTFIEELRENPQKKEVIEEYEKLFGTVTGDLKDQKYYKEYLVNFKILPYQVPDSLEGEFDWQLLGQLIAGSFTSNCELQIVKDKQLPNFNIIIKSEEQLVIEDVANLWSYQVIKLHEIYTEENMNLQILVKEDEIEAQVILAQRQKRVQDWREHIEAMQDILLGASRSIQ